jgi:hypothetical protein
MSGNTRFGPDRKNRLYGYFVLLWTGLIGFFSSLARVSSIAGLDKIKPAIGGSPLRLGLSTAAFGN